VSDHPDYLESLENPGALYAPRLKAVAAMLVLLGMLMFGILLCFDHSQPSRVWGAVLEGLMIPTWISAGALCFIAMNSIGGARWVVPLRRVMEGLSGGFLLTLGAFVLLWWGGFDTIYAWASSASRHDLFHIHEGSKSMWMTKERVLYTSVFAIGAWILLQRRLVGLSLRQDHRLDVIAAHRRWSIVFLLIFGFTFTLFMWDTLLGLQVRFISTTWGFYCMVSALQMFLAVLCVVVTWLARGPLKHVVKPHLLHDLGTWTVAWSCIWAYIAYTQYIIIYFANTNEESYFYLMRLQHHYGQSLFLETLLRFPVPFLVLLSQRMRANPKALTWASAMVLVGCWIDLWWIIMPGLFPNPNQYSSFLHLPELLIGAGFVGAFILLALSFWKRHGVIPRGDPRLLSAINAEHLH
jgi:hypothetical protein